MNAVLVGSTRTRAGRTNMPLKLLSGMMKTSGDEALLIMERNVGGDEIVLVTKEALLDIADPPLCNECRLQQYVTVFSDIASKKFDGKELEPDGRVAVTAADVSVWKVNHPEAT
ncbi:hypothetical protein CN212_20760 [Sinorhizobium meliloti]|nr:hypothetical protein CN238_13170 [Sinorhizobium meliloti]RVG66223.1 hypothetical protein CN220_23345 [Sinorhizobium meliloti]RVH31289.1 hypothetical protein CN214_12505 [Sinorhizobium meliloti]RVH34721.1 hypothetical protein CN211_15385 [Sinorhizobium meliloti]RVH46606.1 hypothetical protein CN212_20760 [Sinorhizobium meliloti]